MTIPTRREPPDMGPRESCCFCRKPTPYWTAIKGRMPGEQVACCQPCAATHDPKDVPTKAQWFNGVKP